MNNMKKNKNKMNKLIKKKGKINVNKNAKIVNIYKKKTLKSKISNDNKKGINKLNPIKKSKKIPKFLGKSKTLNIK